MGTLGIPGYAHSNWYYQIVEKFHVYLPAKINFSPHSFLEILQKYENVLFWVLSVEQVTHTGHDKINLQEISMLSTCQNETSSFTFFLIHYILKNHAIWLANNCIFAYNLRNRISTRHGIEGEKSITISAFNLGYFQEKLQNFSKNLFCGPSFGPFCPNLGENKFSWKKGLFQFLNTPIIYHCAKNQKKLMSH